jgi:hypothetical protein
MAARSTMTMNEEGGVPSILSLPAVSRLAERHVRERGPMTLEALVAWLCSVDVEESRVEAGVRLATTVGRLEEARDADGGEVLRVPSAGGEAA